jgi:hypothetical protein
VNDEGNPLADLLAAKGKSQVRSATGLQTRGWAGSCCLARSQDPWLIMPDSLDEKHKFLEKSKQLRHKGLGLDDWLTDMQQQERSTLNAAFQTLNGKGYKPFFRGSILMYGRSDKACVCQTDTVPLTA